MTRTALTRRQSEALAQITALAHAGVFTTAAALGAGVLPGMLRTLTAKGQVLTIGHGMHRLVADASQPPHIELVRATMARHAPDAVAAHVTAARLHQLRTPFEAQAKDDNIWLLRAPEVAPNTHRNGVAVLPARFEPEHVMLLDGVRVTSLARTALDLARGCPLERALVPIDHALARGVPRGALVELAVYMKGWPGSAVFKPALEIANALSESGLESIARGLVHRESLPAPELQAELRGESGKRYRVDMVWREAGVILEVDGEPKYGLIERAVFLEKRREDDLRRAGWDVVRWTYEDMFMGQRPAVAWLKRALSSPSRRRRSA